MGLVAHVCAALENGDPKEQEAAIVTAASLIEKALGRESAGWDEEILAEPVDHDTIPRLRKALVDFTERHLIPPPVASAIWALTFLDEKALVPLFVRCVGQHARAGSDVGILYQAMNALQRLGEPVFAGGKASLLDSERNLRLAIEYLEKKRPR